jgi:hypothetical protein
MTVAALLLVAGLVAVPVWTLGRRSPLGAPAGAASRSTHRRLGDRERRKQTACRVLVLVGLLLLAFAWASGLVIEEARTYAELQGLTDDGAPRRAQQRVVLACGAVLLLGAALLRASVAAGRRTA